MKYAIRAVGLLVAGLILGLAVVASGVVSVSALEERDGIDALLGYASRRSIEHHATSQTNPVGDDSEALAAGLAHYKANCLACHTVSGIERAEFAKGLHPPAPMLTASRIQAMTDGELHWVVANGIGMTGMPAFSPTHTDGELWQIVAFVRHLPQLTEDERSALAGPRSDESEHHHHEEGDAAERHGDDDHPR